MIANLTLAVALALTVQAAEAPQDPEVAARDRLLAAGLERCRTSPRVDNETVEACAERRVQATIATYGSAQAAPRPADTDLPSQSDPDEDWGDFDQALAESYARSRARSQTLPAAAPPPPPARRSGFNCERRENRVEREGETSTSVSLSCGGDADRARQLLEDIMNRDR